MNYIFARLNDITTWIGVIGIVLLLFQLHDALFILFVFMIILPQKTFGDLFATWTKGVHTIVEDE